VIRTYIWLFTFIWFRMNWIFLSGFDMEILVGVPIWIIYWSTVLLGEICYYLSWNLPCLLTIWSSEDLSRSMVGFPLLSPYLFDLKVKFFYLNFIFLCLTVHTIITSYLLFHSLLLSRQEFKRPRKKAALRNNVIFS